MRYVIIYTNNITVQGHHIYCLVSRINMFLEGKVQRVTSTSPMHVSTVGFVTNSVMSLIINFIHVRNCWKM